MQRCIPEVFWGPFSISETLNNQSWSAWRPGVSGFSRSGALYQAFLNEPRIYTQERANPKLLLVFQERIHLLSTPNRLPP
jgi:hypothetical protein